VQEKKKGRRGDQRWYPKEEVRKKRNVPGFQKGEKFNRDKFGGGRSSRVRRKKTIREARVLPPGDDTKKQ